VYCSVLQCVATMYARLESHSLQPMCSFAVVVLLVLCCSVSQLHVRLESHNQETTCSFAVLLSCVAVLQSVATMYVHLESHSQETNAVSLSYGVVLLVALCRNYVCASRVAGASSMLCIGR